MLFVVIFERTVQLFTPPGTNRANLEKIPPGWRITRTPPGEFNTYNLPGVVTFVKEIGVFGGSEKPGGIPHPTGGSVA